MRCTAAKAMIRTVAITATFALATFVLLVGAAGSAVADVPVGSGPTHYPGPLAAGGLLRDLPPGLGGGAGVEGLPGKRRHRAGVAGAHRRLSLFGPAASRMKLEWQDRWDRRTAVRIVGTREKGHL